MKTTKHSMKFRIKLFTLAALVMFLVTTGFAETNQIAFTNPVSVASVTNAGTDWCDRIPASAHAQAIKDLATGGIICKVLGHQWRDGRPGEGEGSPYSGWYADHHSGITYRTCRICGKGESKTVGEWK